MHRRSPGAWFTLTLFGLWTLIPLYWLVSTSLKAPAEATASPPGLVPKTFDISAYTTALAEPALRSGLVNSLLTALGATAISVSCGLLAGYALGHLATRRTDRYEFWVLSSRMAPPVAVALPFFLMFQTLNLLDTVPGLVLAHVVLVVGIITWILVETFRSIPKDILEAALIDGCSYRTAFTKVVVPLAVPGVVGAASIAFLLSWNDFFLALVLTNTDAATAPLAVYQAIGFQTLDMAQLAATSTIVLIPTALIVGFFQRQLVSGLTMGAVKG